jgi:hypothetical protein
MKRIGSILPVGNADPAVHRGCRRRCQRYPLDAEVEVIEPTPAEGIVINASAGGLRVMLDRPVSEGADYTLAVRFTDERTSRETVRVVWVRQHPDGWVVGLQFLDVTWPIPEASRRSRAA